jgi:hypothetical protein
MATMAVAIEARTSDESRRKMKELEVRAAPGAWLSVVPDAGHMPRYE